MSRILSVAVLAAGVLAVWFWASGGFDQLAAWASSEQRDFQNQIARNLRALRAGDAGAFTLLLTVCFAYGFFHAVGPGHGKVVIGGYGLGRQVPWKRLVGISLLASLGQAVTAIALVYAGVWIFRLTRQGMVGLAEDVMAPVSYGAIVLVGLWLCWRGLRGLSPAPAGHDHHGHHDHEACGHRHGPTADEITRAGTLKEALAVSAGIAARPCTGALFVLIITWQMGIALAGIAGAFAMALGTATVTVAVALAAFGFRGGLLGAVAGSGIAARVVPAIEIAAGALVVVVAGGLLMRAL